MGTNDFRSTKRPFTRALLVGSDGYGLSITSDGCQHLRAMVRPDHIAVHVLDWFGGTASRVPEWCMNYGKDRLLKTYDERKATLRLQLFSKEVASA